MNALKRREIKAAQDKMVLDSAGRFLGGAKDLAIELAKQPAFQMVGAVVLIESLQRINVTRTVKINDTFPYTFLSPKYEVQQVPLISQELATALETALISTSALNAIGGLSGITGLLGALK